MLFVNIICSNQSVVKKKGEKKAVKSNHVSWQLEDIKNSRENNSQISKSRFVSTSEQDVVECVPIP